MYRYIWAVLLLHVFMQGFTYDHAEFNIYLNGKPTNAQFTGIRGTVYPVVYGQYSCTLYYMTFIVLTLAIIILFTDCEI